MKRISSFFKTSLIGGLVVILPIAILLFVFKWLFNLVTDIIQPLTDLLITTSHLYEIVADIIVIAIIIISCFLVGVFVTTTLGKFMYRHLENRILRIFPGYSLVKETILQFIGNKKSPFSTVALVQAFGNETLVTAFITDTHDDGSYTVFIPTGPNPTSGNICHLKSEYVHIVDVSVEDTMRSIISCGSGSTKLINSYSQKIKG